LKNYLHQKAWVWSKQVNPTRSVALPRLIGQKHDYQKKLNQDHFSCSDARRDGTPGYGFSSSTWIRGFLKDEYDVDPADMEWIQTCESSDGKKISQELQRFYLPDDFPLSLGPPGIDESELLLSGGCDALITAITPRAYLQGNPNIRQLFPDVQEYESTRAFFATKPAAQRLSARNQYRWSVLSVAIADKVNSESGPGHFHAIAHKFEFIYIILYK